MGSCAIGGMRRRYPALINEIWDFGDAVTLIKNRHTLTIGFAGRKIRYNMVNGAGLGRVNYNGQYSGDVFADALLGAGASVALTELGPLSNPAVSPSASVLQSVGRLMYGTIGR